ncbi:hypothetical protein BCR15_11490 [Tessaracoccus lapidicaptus]|uniref:Class C sortase n=1 Tax=Tessaracoccus lapidicaptus TaxID=1427523 RepID=A0A1C0ARW3_9ACTN|nr:class C sortase [Tessaracoccus lapidicaptus]OCL37086.1 hypothetical protein BCR15_11490 [Tessaracoccus lapidicaptus]
MTTQVPPQEAPRRAASTRRGASGILIPLLIVLAGVLVLTYPILATQYNNYKQREFALEYNNEVQKADPVDLSADLAAAEEYNSRIEGVPILDPWLTHVSADPRSTAYREYLGLLSDFSVMARVRVPSVNIDLPVEHGTTDAVIGRAAGHLYGTSLPVGGESTHSVLTTHTGMATATLFDHLIDVEEGDLVFVDVYGQTLAYEVDQIKVVLPNEVEDLTVVQGEDLLTLFTCTPYAVNTHRLLVRGHRVDYIPPRADDSPLGDLADTFVLEPWMRDLLIGVGIGVLAVVAIIGREIYVARRKDPAGRSRR